MHTQLAKSIYKTALRRAIAFDKEPVLKVGLFSSPSDCSVLSPRSPLTGTTIKSKTDRRKKETIAKIAWTPFSGFHFTLFPSKVITNSIPWIGLCLRSFVSKFNKHAKKRQLHCISLFIQFSSSAFPALLRLSDYLHSCLLYASNSGFIKSKMESTLPAPRDGAIRSSPFPVVRECYDRIHPSLETEARDQYAGYVLIQNPSALLQLKNWDEDDDRVKALLSSSVVAPSPLPHSRCTFSPPSRTSTRCSSSASASHTALSFLVRSTLPRALMT